MTKKQTPAAPAAGTAVAKTKAPPPALPDAAAIVADVRARFIAAKRDGPAAFLRAIAAGLEFADTAGKIDVGVRLAAGEELAQVKRVAPHGAFAAACDEVGFSKQRAAEYIAVAEKFKVRPVDFCASTRLDEMHVAFKT